ncbi:major facilitator superfamily MFS_1 (plasmid) [Rhizobium leguminosarum bv. trifolii WSM1325]|uniref:Major facilitator superfamily MFS_1 n=1 Tax=Rhizobium leguminosarum bv. trifolii (strain WSM1325) TaxID=395491 RepID=C6B8V7_RHILS|nr:MFS transporter [Rhizobium leguminosarum]ACS60345.1 major facilitator superfamily MFS_1 [Rhizobium leguminosarum bv. trifolii WSM1325]
MEQGARVYAVGGPTAAHGFEYSTDAWRVLGALWVVVLLVVAVPSAGISVINAQMIADLDLDRSVFGLGFGMFVMMMGFQGPIVAMLMQKFGYQRTVTVGCFVLLIGSVIMATLVNTGWQYVLAFGVIVGTGVCVGGMLPAQSAIARWFHVRRALAVSVVLSAVEFGGFLSPPSLDRLLAASNNNWRLGWWVIAGLATVALLITRFALNERHVERLVAAHPTKIETSGETNVFKSQVHWLLREAVKTRAYWLILTYMSVAGVAWVFLMAHGVVHLQDIGYSSADTAMAMAITIVASFFGNMAAGFLGDRISPAIIAVASMVFVTLGFFLLVHPQGFTGILMYAAPAGIGYGASQVCVMALLGNYFGRESFPSMFGSMMPVSTLCAASGAAAAGAIFDQTGSYDLMFNIIVGLCVVGALAMLLASPPRPTRIDRDRAAEGVAQ